MCILICFSLDLKSIVSTILGYNLQSKIEERQRNRADRIGDNEVESTSGNQYDVPVDRIIEAEQRGEGREDQLVAFEADRYDVAVLTLSRPVSYQPHISPICLPDKGDDFEGDYVWAAGWGVMVKNTSKDATGCSRTDNKQRSVRKLAQK
ncbi:hypothetical protein QYM36_005693 [Artemia franciscana]|uniref:Peptidase S1 domain-containing protein n=1 Tax=Artemia franciscana TaxID=6661 RepID=A0AA88I542_ARTSF|nr:hypothetical protein QYM36_005693 [Artemia franciscana]